MVNKILNTILKRGLRVAKRPLRKYPTVLNKAMKTTLAKLYYSNFAEPPNYQHSIIDESAILGLSEGKIVLDCGCGIGRWGYLLRKKGYTVVGFDIKKNNTLQAKKYSKYQDLVVADASCIPFKDVTFDCLIAIELLEHLPKKKGIQFLNETKRLTKRKVVLSTPSGFFEALCDLPEEKHQAGWTQAELEEQGFFCSIHKNRLYDWLLCTYIKKEH
jgi:ubiquinone/menaquinone biosynthesis C-methylase UbiE